MKNGEIKKAKSIPYKERKFDKEKAYKRNHEWKKANNKNYLLAMNIRTDADVIEKLNKVPSKRNYILSLIKEDIKKNGI